MEIKVKNATIPTRGSGYDLYACLSSDHEMIAIEPHTTVKTGTGLSFESPPEGTFAAIFARSGLATKQGLAPANKVGVCDSDYRGKYIVALHNDSTETRFISNGDRIAQLVLLPYVSMTFIEVDTLDGTDRGDGGFGSTGIN